MKYLIPLIVLMVLISCTEETVVESEETTYDDTTSCPEGTSDFNTAMEVYMGDTVNYMDENGLKQGVWLDWHQQGGNMYWERFYVNDTLHGFYTKYYADGNIKEYGEYNWGERSGHWDYYSNMGIIDSTVNYDELN